MTIKSHYIKGTDKQYSIREDGVMIKHYIARSNQHTPVPHKYPCHKIVKYDKRGVINLKINGVRVAFSKNKLFILYFGYYICVKCGKKEYISEYKRKQYCKDCRRLYHNISATKHYNNNKEKFNAYKRGWRERNRDRENAALRKYRQDNPDIVRKATKKRVDSLTKSYVATLLGVTVNELSDELYNHHKQLILFKRNVAKEQNISIYSLSK